MWEKRKSCATQCWRYWLSARFRWAVQAPRRRTNIAIAFSPRSKGPIVSSPATINACWPHRDVARNASSIPPSHLPNKPSRHSRSPRGAHGVSITPRIIDLRVGKANEARECADRWRAHHLPSSRVKWWARRQGAFAQPTRCKALIPLWKHIPRCLMVRSDAKRRVSNHRPPLPSFEMHRLRDAPQDEGGWAAWCSTHWRWAISSAIAAVDSMKPRGQSLAASWSRRSASGLFFFDSANSPL